MGLAIRGFPAAGDRQTADHPISFRPVFGPAAQDAARAALVGLQPSVDGFRASRLNRLAHPDAAAPAPSVHASAELVEVPRLVPRQSSTV